MDNLWEHEDKASEHVEVPRWIDQDICGNQLEAINQGGCASGAYMPAVTYHEALKTMSEHGDEVIGYLADMADCDGLPNTLPEISSWSGLACHWLSQAVELWASGAARELLDALNAEQVKS